MRRNLSKKRIGALTLTVIMAIQIPTMATETTLENTEQICMK